MKSPSPVIALLCLLSAVSLSAQEESSLPYNSVNKTMVLLASRKIGGVDCVPWYLKGNNETYDPVKARPRVVTWEGEEHPLEVQELSSLAPDQLDKTDKRMIEKGFTHRMWVPKGDKRFLDGKLTHSLPRGSVEMSQSIGIEGGTGKK